MRAELRSTTIDNISQGCECFDDDEHAQLEDWEANGAPTPADTDWDDYVLLRDQILQKARNACVDRADALGWDNNNCLLVLDDDDDLVSNGMSGECQYEEIAVDTDGSETDGVPPDPNPYDLSGLTCDAGTCRAPRALIDDMFSRPEAFLLDSTRIEFRPDGRLQFTRVASGDVAYIAGIRTGDTLMTVNGSHVKSLDDAAELLGGIRNDSSATITIEDRYGKNVSLTISLY